MTEQFANLAKSTLNGAINASVTTITVANGAIFPSSGNYRILVDNELMLVTARTVNNLTVTRAIEGTTAASHLTGVNVALVFTAALMQTLWNSLSTFQGDVSGAGHSLSGILNLFANNVETTTLQNFASGTIAVLSNLDLGANYLINVGSISTVGSITLGYGASLSFTSGGGGSIFLEGGTLDSGGGNIQNVNVAQANEMHFDTLAGSAGNSITVNSNLFLGSFSIDAQQFSGGSFSGDASGLSNYSYSNLGGTPMDSSGDWNVDMNSQSHNLFMGGGLIQFTNGLITDASSFISINPTDRLLFATNGSTETIDYSLNGFNSNAGISFGQSGVIDFYVGGVIRSGNDGNTSLNPNGRTAGDSNNNTAIDWSNRYLVYNNIQVVDWGQQRLYDPSVNISMDWLNRILFRSSGSNCINYSGTIDTGSPLSFTGSNAVFSSVIKDTGGSHNSIDTNSRIGYGSDGTTSILSWNSTAGLTLGKKLVSYNGVTCNDALVVRSTQRFAAQTAAKTSVVSLTAQAGDASYLVSANVNITASTAFSFTVTCTYTDETNTSRTLTLPFIALAGTSLTAITNAGGAVPYEGIAVQIRAKGGTTITISSVGTFTTVTYNIEGLITQTAN